MNAAKPAFRSGQRNAEWQHELPPVPQSERHEVLAVVPARGGRTSRRRLVPTVPVPSKKTVTRRHHVAEKPLTAPQQQNRGHSTRVDLQASQGGEPPRHDGNRNKIQSAQRYHVTESAQWPRAVLENIVQFVPHHALTKLVGLSLDMCYVVAKAVAVAAMAATASGSGFHLCTPVVGVTTVIERRSLTAKGESGVDGPGAAGVDHEMRWNDGMIVANACLLRIGDAVFAAFVQRAFDGSLPVSIMDAVVLTVTVLTRESSLLTTMSDSDAWEVACDDMNTIIRQNNAVSNLLVDMSFCGVDPVLHDAMCARLAQRGAIWENSIEHYLCHAAEDCVEAGVILSWFATFAYYHSSKGSRSPTESCDSLQHVADQAQ